jgi:hypothetical protein
LKPLLEKSRETGKGKRGKSNTQSNLQSL